jgi:zinc D-Ala-D-Ala carboxypeptidase
MKCLILNQSPIINHIQEFQMPAEIKKPTRLKKIAIPIAFVLLILVFLAVSNATKDSPHGLQPGLVASENSHTPNAIPDKMPSQIIFPSKNILLGKLTSAHMDSIMVLTDRKYGNRDGLYMHKEAYESFIKMHSEANKSGIELTIISAFRNFDHQKRIWDNKWNGRQLLSGNISATSISSPTERALEILRFSSMPGTSRHHWGTDIDINSLNNSYFESGRGLKEYNWLKENAHRFGFYQPYTPRTDREDKGYEEEKWHWSYLPVATVYLKGYKHLITIDDLDGFDGYETSAQLDVINNYVMAIDKQCLDYTPTTHP